METKHTQGPWRFDSDIHSCVLQDNDGYHYIEAGKGFPPDGFSICGFMPDGDARLIAAAPDLLEAAHWCIALCEEIGAIETNAYAAAKAAIAKAEGVQTTDQTQKGEPTTCEGAEKLNKLQAPEASGEEFVHSIIHGQL